MWWRNWWEAVRDPFDPVPRRLWKALILLAVGLFGIYVVWPRVRIEWLVVNLHANPDSPTAREAAWRLGELGSTARGALPTLIEALDAGPIEPPAAGNAEQPSRIHHIGLLSVEAAQAIRKIGDPQTVAELHQRMMECRNSESDEGLGAARLYIALKNAGGVHAGPHPDAADDIAEVFDVLQDSQNSATCNVLLNWIHARSLVSPASDHDGRFKPILVDCLSRLHVSVAARILIAWAEQDPAVIPAILDEERRLYREQPQSFVSSGVLYQPIHGRDNPTIRNSLPLLTDELDGPDAPMIARLLAESYWFDRQQDDRYRRQPPGAELLIEHFRQSLNDENGPVRRGTVQILTRIAETAADHGVPTDTLFTPEILGRMEQLLTDQNQTVRLASAVALWKIRQQAEPGLAELLAGLDSPDEVPRKQAETFFRGLGPHDLWATTALTAHLPSESSRVRVAILHGLAALGPDARDSIPSIVATLKTDDEITLIAAVESLAVFGPEAREALPQLWEVFLHSDDVGIRRLANTAMAKIDPNRRNRDQTKSEP